MNLKINKRLLALKIHYFFKYGGIAFFTFLPVVARQKGIPELAIGLMWTVTPLLSCALNLLASTIADAFKIHHAMFLAGLIVLSASFIVVFLLPDVSDVPNAHIKTALSIQCHDEDISRLAVCMNESFSDNMFRIPSFQDCNGKYTHNNASEEMRTIMNCMLNCTLFHYENSEFLNVNETYYLPSNISLSFSNESSSYSVCEDNCMSITEADSKESVMHLYNITCGQTYYGIRTCDCGSQGSEMKHNKILTDLMRTPEFWLIFILLVLIYGGNATTTTMADTVCFSLLGENRHKYGHQRMWGSLGWGMFGVINGALVDLYSEGEAQTNYTPALIISSILLTINLLVAVRMKFDVTDKEKLKAVTVRNAICSLKMIILLVTVVVVGMSMGVVWTFLFIVAEDVAVAWNPDFAHLKLLEGLMVGSTYFLGEVPFFFLSSYIIEKLGSIPTFALSLIMLSLRFFLYSIITNPWFFLLIDMLHGISFGILYPNMISYGSSVAPKGAQAIVQGIVKSLFIAGSSIGGMLGGLLVDAVGGSMAFFYVGVFDGAFTVFFIIAQYFIKRTDSRDSQEDQEDVAPEEDHIT